MKPYPAIDVDGVLADMVSYVSKRLDFNPALITKWEYSQCVGELIASQFEIMLKEPEIWVGLQPYPDAYEVKRLLEANFEFCIISDVPEEYADLRAWWFQRHFGGDFEGHPVSVKLIRAKRHEKAHWCRYFNITHILEDNADTAAACAERGIKAFLVPRPYNEGEHQHIPRCTVGQFVDYMLKGGDGPMG